MTDEVATIALRARFVFPVAGPPRDGGVVTIRGDRIVSVGNESTAGRVLDLEHVAIVPGLVNAHTHLEFSDLERPLGQAGVALPRWILQVIERRGVAAISRQEIIARGLAECLASGTTTVGEIATSDWRTLVGPPTPRPDVVMFHEFIAPTRERIDQAIATAEAFAAAKPVDARIRPGLSPHAPYTVHPGLLSALVDLSVRADLAVAMHLAESPEEVELLATGGGEFRALLERLNAWDPGPGTRLPSIEDYLRVLSRAPRALVVHGNYLTDREVAYLAERASRMALVYCPRTHDFFRHADYPLADMLSRGATVALGTDSRGSNPDLSLWEEMRFVAARHPRVSPADVLSLGTRAGAGALGVDNQVGTIEPGKLANLAVIELGAGSPADPHALLFDAGGRVVQTWLRGQLVFESAGG
jgi:cytosine/adenosine deaminase-related metal-dependent hydrolase